MARQALTVGSSTVVYDFRSATGAQRPHLRTLARMHEVLIERLGSTLSRLMRAEASLELVAVELATFDEYVRSMPTPTVAATFGMLPLDGRAVAELNPQLAILLLERLLGGPGSLPQLRRLTDIEAAVLSDVVDAIVDGLTATFDPLLEVQPRFSEYVFDPEFLDVAEPADTIVLLAFQISLALPGGATTGILTLCYPTSLIAPVLRQLAVTDPQDESAVVTGPLGLLLPEVAVEVTVSLQPTLMPASDLASLRPGDVLRLDHRLGDLVETRVGEATIMVGHLGRRGPRLAVQAVQVRKAPPPPAGAEPGMATLIPATQEVDA